MISLCLPDTVQNAVNLPLQNSLLPFPGHRNLFKLGMSNDDGIIIAGGNPGAELLPVFGFKVFLGCHQNIGRGIQLEPFRGPLLCDMIWYNNQRLCAYAQALALHSRRNNFEGLPCPHFVCQKGVSTIHDVGNGINLVLPQGDFRIHS